MSERSGNPGPDRNARRLNPKFQQAFFRYLSVLLILIAILCIWYFKKTSERPAPAADNPDFSLNVTGSLDLEQLKSYALPILLDFGADYCEPCRRQAPIIEELNRELQGKAIIRYIDVVADPDIAQEYPISVIPTQIFIDAEGNPYNPADPQALSMILYSRKASGEHAFTAHEGILTKEQLLTILADMGMK